MIESFYHGFYHSNACPLGGGSAPLVFEQQKKKNRRPLHFCRARISKNNTTQPESEAREITTQNVHMPANDGGSEADDLDSIVHTTSIRIEYYRSFEYRLTLKQPMSPRRSSRIEKAPEKTQVINGGLDIIDIINNTHNNHAECVAEEEEGEGMFTEVTDEGVDQSDEDGCVSDTCSVTSGPSSLLCDVTPVEPWPTQGSCCSACHKLYQKAKRMKTPIRKKLLDNDPKSLTCDQWVLIKKWRLRRLPIAPGKLLKHVRLFKKRLAKNVAKQTELCVSEGESTGCSRQHTFLQRNLRRCVREPVINGKRKKRRRDDSQGSRVAKQQRLQGNNNKRKNQDMISEDDGSLHSASGQGSDQESCDLTVELIPSEITLETHTDKARAASPEKKAQKKTTSGFRDLLAQLRGNGSRIVRETR